MARCKARSAVKKIILFGALLIAGSVAFADRYSHLELFAQTLNLIKINYFKPIKIETLVQGAVKGLLREIDPHSSLLRAKDVEKLKEEVSGLFYGMGIEVEAKDSYLTVISVIPKSPAQKAGFQPGDQILQIGDKSAKGFNSDEFRHILKKRRKKTHKIKVLRADPPQELVLAVQPGRLKLPSSHFEKIEEGLFYIRVYYFSEKTLWELNQTLKNKKIKGLILDLRGNPGGLFESAVQTADLFLNEGLIVSYKIRTEKKAKEFFASYSDTLPGFPLTVLINEFSASASEIVAGALKDHKRALLAGRATFGKGSIQNIFPLRDSYALKLTVGEYQTPSGRSIHKTGIEPDIKIEKQEPIKQSPGGLKTALTDPEIHQAFEILKRQVNKSKKQSGSSLSSGHALSNKK